MSNDRAEGYLARVMRAISTWRQSGGSGGVFSQMLENVDQEYGTLIHGLRVEDLDNDDPLRRMDELADTLLNTHCKDFFRTGVAVGDNIDVTTKYGVLDSVVADIDEFIEQSHRVFSFSAFPFVNRITFTGEGVRFDELIDLRCLDRVRHFKFPETVVGDKRLSFFLGSDLSIGVRSLDFSFWGDGDKDIRSNLGAVFTVESALAISSAGTMTTCENLDLGYNSIGVAGITALANSKYLGNLRTLVCTDSEFGDEGLEVIGYAPGFPSLRSLGCGYNQLSPAGVQDLFSGPIGRQLTSVALHGSNLTTGTGFPLEIVKEAPLRHLHMNFCELTAEGMSELMESDAFPEMCSLSLRQNQIAGGFASVFAGARPLRKVDVSRNGIDDDALEKALAQRHADHLEWIDLGENLLTDRAARVLSHAPQLSKLEVLHLTGNQITDEGSRELRESSYLRNVKLLHLTGLLLSEAERERLTQRFGKGVIFR